MDVSGRIADVAVNGEAVASPSGYAVHIQMREIMDPAAPITRRIEQFMSLGSRPQAIRGSYDGKRLVCRDGSVIPDDCGCRLTRPVHQIVFRHESDLIEFVREFADLICVIPRFKPARERGSAFGKGRT